MSRLPRQIQQQADDIALFDQELEAEAQPVEEDNEPAAEEQAAPPAAPAPAPAPPPEDPWKQRYQSLQGMFNAETARRDAEIAELRKMVAAKDSGPPPAAPQPQSPVISDEDREIFGDDLIELIGRKAAEVAQQTVSKLESEIKRLESVNADLASKVGTVEQVQGDVARQDYYQRLTAMVPDLDQLNAHQPFLDWLGQKDPLTNLARQAYLDDAFAAYDVARTAAIFNAYKAETQPAPAPQPARRQPKLEEQVAPGNTGQASPLPTDTGGKVWTMREIDDFYASVKRGDWKGREEAAAKREAEIDLAVQQGRLRD